MVEHLLRHVAHLVALRARTGRLIALALEPEPDCFLETIDEVVAFFQRELHASGAVRRLIELTGLDRVAAAQALHDHLGLCLDLCHAAVEFEDAAQCIRRLDVAGIRVHKMQISAGLRLPTLDPAALEALQRFDDPVYLHQVVQRGPGGLTRFNDLPEAFAALQGATADREWRVHFHVPIFLDQLAPFASTQSFIREVLEIHRARPVSAHLEVETYTWGVLPEPFRSGTVDEAVARELAWVRTELERLNLSLALRLGRISNLPTVWTNVLVGALLAGGSLADPRLPLSDGRAVAVLRGRHVPQRCLRSRVRCAASPGAADPLGPGVGAAGVRHRLRAAGVRHGGRDRRESWCGRHALPGLRSPRPPHWPVRSCSTTRITRAMR